MVTSTDWSLHDLILVDCKYFLVFLYGLLEISVSSFFIAVSITGVSALIDDDLPAVLLRVGAHLLC